LGVPQTVVETQYYMSDLPKLLTEKVQEKYLAIFEQILVRLATNNRGLEESEYKKFVESITKQLKTNQTEGFDRDKFEELRFLTNLGANKAR
jgi:hypothetical protein